MNQRQKELVAEEFREVLAALATPRTAHEVVEATGRSRTRVDRGLRALVLAGLVLKLGKRPQPSDSRGQRWGMLYQSLTDA